VERDTSQKVGIMPATTNGAYESQSWTNDEQQQSSTVTAGSNDFSSQQWTETGRHFGITMNDDTQFPAVMYGAPNGQTFSRSNTFGDGSLHPTTSLTSSTTYDPFSPSEYASDSAAFGDPLSDYGTPSFDHTFAEFQNTHMTNTISPASLLSSPESAHVQSFPPLDYTNMNMISPTAGHTQPAVTSHPQNMSGQKPTRPQLVVTVDEYEDSSSNNEAIQPARRRNSSKAHLSPYPIDDDTSDEDEDSPAHPNNKHAQTPPTRSIAHPSLPMTGGRTGVAPDIRSSINHDEIPSLHDIEEQHRIDEKNAEVEDWLTNSDVGSNAGDAYHVRRSKKRRPRAKSTNDSPYNGPAIKVPGPGLTINVPSEMDEEEGYDSGWTSGSPVTGVVTGGEADSYFAMTGAGDQFGPSQVSTGGEVADDMDKEVEGIAANLAIMRFRKLVADTDSASVTATLGSRRLSESDIGSVRGNSGISKLLLSPQQSERKPRRKNSWVGNILPNLTMSGSNSSNKLKRKNSQPVEKAEATPSGGVTSPKESQGTFAAPKRIGSFGRSKTPKVDTTISPVLSDVKSPKSVAGAATGMVRQIWRSRSRSDLGKSPKMGLAQLMTQHGGPPIPTLVSPLQPRAELVPQNSAHFDEDSDNEDGLAGGDGLTMDLSVRTDMHIIPTLEGFRYQTRQLNPRVAEFLLERVAQEQVKRYKRLVDAKAKHNEHVTSGSCSAKGFCLLSGGQSNDLPPRPGNKDPDNALVGFQIMRPGMTEDDLDMSNEGQTMVAAQFPSGVPLPPVNRLPAEFECPLCFKVKKFYKPSDWTKHVHEDVQPFVCTFAGCNESKPFKRKADWVRHENERHRQLESWVCSVQDCNHTCYRKDNFVQHLVREHKVPDPKARTGRAPRSPFEASQSWSNSAALEAEGVSDVWELVDKCHRDSTKLPKDEPCKFCGNICTSWKKLTVHLAKHMEQISMPVLPLVEQKKTSFAMYNQRTQVMPQSMPMSTKPMSELPTFLYAEPMSFEAEPQSMLSVDQAYVPQGMHSYPPTNMALLAQMSSSQADLTASALNMANASYPPPSIQSRSRGSSFNEQDYPRQSGSTYPPPGMHSRTMSASTPPQFDNNGNPMFISQNTGMMYMQEPMASNNVYLTPTSNTPASMGYSPGSSTHSLHQTYGFHA